MAKSSKPNSSSDEALSNSSSSSEEEEQESEDPAYVPSEFTLSSMPEDDSDDSGCTLSLELPASPQYHPGPMEDDPEILAPVHADGVDPDVPMAGC